MHSWQQDKWSPALQIRTVLLSIQALMSAPNPDDPLDNAVAEMWKTNEPMALRTGMLPMFYLLELSLQFITYLCRSTRMDCQLCKLIDGTA